MQKLTPISPGVRRGLRCEVYTLTEVATLLGMSYTSAREAAKAGRMPVAPIRAGRAYLFPKRPVDRLLGKSE